MQDTFDINGIKAEFKNVSFGTRYVPNMFKKEKENITFRNSSIELLLNQHPGKNIDNIEYLVLHKREPFNKIALFYKIRNEENEDDVSYIICLSSLYGKYNRDKMKKNDVIKSFRDTIHNTKKKAFSNEKVK